MILEYCLLGASAAATGLFSIFWHKKARTLGEVKDAPVLELNEDLVNMLSTAPNQTLPYAVIEGNIKAVEQSIKSEYVVGVVGVIQTLLCREHKTEWSKSTRLWYDTTRLIRDTTKHVPFEVTRGKVGLGVEDALVATGLELETIHDKFFPYNTSLGNNILSWASGEKTKGFQEIERMLPEGALLTGVGELAIVNGKMMLRPPTSGLDYILSLSGQSGILRELRSKLRRWKVLVAICGSTTVVMLCIVLWKWFKRYQEQRSYDMYVQRVIQQRAVQSEGSDVDDLQGRYQDLDSCAICLSRPRDCVLLNCGHVCACSECAIVLQPPQCPICRDRIARIVPLYHA
ncbi:mitochondrial ubiquitin ligase activator of NFKB 1 [Strongylocentrotus purpuratus]|uniref:RING-type E3 ubiquitin transferase n=1 Tax=Strongylocentrotus purpuratus TaxID=7668 RepID=A0A7M7PBB2_STRPU|nr:mitochondrial ubiquitin ligase activator of NFKB 1 [Strongylocentrotus purpuratus]|eukprot:XP_798763.1 PREDICTED: mitochondrial ubiquitin ligase activator of NFKB 1 [Strongylocentrotus purpuratus]